MRLIIALVIIILLNVCTCTFIAQADEVPACVLITKQIRDIAWNDPDAFDMDHLKQFSRIDKYMCVDIPTDGWDWIEYGARLIKLCKEFSERCT